jgi:sarcosine oxidase
MVSNKSVDVIVVGLGAHGSAAVWQLAKRGTNVLGFDAYAPPHTLGSSHGDTRVIREVYAEHPDYVPIVQRAYGIWRELEDAVADSGEPSELLRIVGGLTVGHPEGDGVTGVQRSAEEHNLAIEVLDPSEIRRRWPQFRPRDDMVGTLDPRSGVLFPDKCVAAHLDQAGKAGADLRYNEPVLRWHPDGGGVRVFTDSDEYTADQIVFSAGAWNPGFVSKLKLPLKLERQVLFWFRPASSPELFSPDNSPNHSWEWCPGKGIYAQPDFGGGVKIAFHHDGVMFDDPAHIDRTVRDSDERSLRNAFADLIPHLNGRVMKSAVCLYTNTPDHHFLLDWHPGHRNVIICSPCSGHGFKFSAAVGEIIADMATIGDAGYDMSLFGVERLLSENSQSQCPDG